MAFELSISAITPPDGIQHADRKTEILELPLYLRVNAATEAEQLKVVYVGDTPPGPEHIDNVWLKTDEAGTAHGFYQYDAIAGVWNLMAGPGVIVGGGVPSNTNILWLKTDETDAILTPGGSAEGAQKGLYAFNGTAWVVVGYKAVHVGTTAPTDLGRAWVKTDDATKIRGVYAYNTGASAWELIAGAELDNMLTPVTPPANDNKVMAVRDDLDPTYGFGIHVYQPSSGTWLPGHKGKTIIYQTTTPTTAAQKKCLWCRLATVDDMSQGLFYWDGAHWASLMPISIWERGGPGTVSSGVFTLTKFHTLKCAFDESPEAFVAITIIGDTEPAAEFKVGGYIEEGKYLTIVGYNGGTALRKITYMIMATGYQTR